MKLAVNYITIGKRFRKDTGSLIDLSKSMHDLGLLHPIVINSKHELIAGLRRLEAAKLLGWKEIECTVVKCVDDAMKAMQAERDENTCRLDFTPLEIVAIGLKLEEIEKPAAKERQREAQERGRQNKGKLDSEIVSESTSREDNQTRAKVGKAVGVSGVTYNRMKAVAKAAEEDPDTFGAIAEEMDKTGNASGAFRKMQAIKSGKRPVPKHEGNGKAPVGVTRANEAIDCLIRIPRNDPHRKRGFQIVADWIKSNK